MNEEFNYGIDYLTSSKALAISRGSLKGVLNAESREKVKKGSENVSGIVASGRAVYGINTGFGPLCTTMISGNDVSLLQENLLKSHAAGTGEIISTEIARLMLVLKAQALAKGFSGIRESTLDRILWMIEEDIIPAVPAQGSVGASGDLAPLAHLFLPLIGFGQVFYKGRLTEMSSVLQTCKQLPLILDAKEGLALINGTQFIAAHAVVIIEKFHRLLNNSMLISAMMVEGLLGSAKPFIRELHDLRPFAGNRHVAEVVSRLLADSAINSSHSDCTRVQDPYSLRCIPQVHGASWNAWLHLKELLETELNSVTDNPIVYSSDHTISGGNFHGQPLALPLDYACIAVSELGNISDRRIYLSLEGKVPGVPRLLLRETGLNSGFMIVQYTSAALASENKGLCFPASADSIPTSLGQEDHVSMGSISARKCLQVLRNVERILGIELFCAAQAMDFHAPLRSGKTLTRIHEFVRSEIPHLTKDEPLQRWMQTAMDIVSEGRLIATAETEGDIFSTQCHELFNRF